MSDWSQKSREEVLAAFDVDAASGLSSSKASALFVKYGRNRPDSRRSAGLRELLDDHLTTFASVVLCLSAGLLVIFSFTSIHGQLTSFKEPFLVLLLLTCLVLVGLLRGLRISERLNNLRTDPGAHVRVRRGGKLQSIMASSIVPGDVVILRSGQQVPADIRLIKVSSLTINETFITGAPLPVAKRVFPTPPGETLLEAQKNMAFAGSFVTGGHGEGVVTTTGKHTELGKIMRASRRRKVSRTTLQKLLVRRSRSYWLPLLGVSALVFILAYLRESNTDQIFRILESLMLAAALAVAAKPLSISSLVLDSILVKVTRSSLKGIMLRSAAGFESLSSADVICIDKLGKSDAEYVHHLQSESGVRIVIFADTHKGAEEIIALNAGIDGDILSSAELRHMSHQLLKKNVRFNSVFVTEDSVLKLRIVHALKSNRYRVAVIGSTSEDITAMKVADAAVTTADCAADVVACADVILPDKHLSSVYHLILDARHSVMNMRLFLRALVGYALVLIILVISSLTIYSEPLLSASQLLLAAVFFSVVAPWILYRRTLGSQVAQSKPADFIK